VVATKEVGGRQEKGKKEEDRTVLVHLISSGRKRITVEIVVHSKKQTKEEEGIGLYLKYQCTDYFQERPNHS
jgi:hypothetical protein